MLALASAAWLRVWTGFLRPLLTAAIPVPVWLAAAIAVWWQVDRTSAVRGAVDKAVSRLVDRSEIAGLRAQLDRERAVRAANERALAGYTRALAESTERQALLDQQREQEIADRETDLAEAGRACLLDDADVDWLRHGR